MPTSDERTVLPNTTDFVRYFSGTRLDGDRLVAGSLVIPPDHEGEMSIQQLGVLQGDLQADLAEMRRRSRLALRASGRFVRWNVGQFKVAALSDGQVPPLQFLADPLPAEGDWLPDEAHSVIAGISSETIIADLLLDLVRPYIMAMYPAKLAPQATT